MNLSETEENYIKAVFYLSQEDTHTASTNAIAARMNTKAASVSDMLKKLAEKDLLVYVKYKGATLSKKGTKIALRLVRKHRLWEVFLVEKLGFKWDKVHHVAEQLEHIKSPDLVKRLDEFLNFPKFDPHGDPIPDEEGNVTKLQLQKLTSFKEDDQVLIMGVADTSSDFLQYLNQLGLALGLKVVVGKRFTFDLSQEIIVNNQKTVISHLVASNLLVNEIK